MFCDKSAILRDVPFTVLVVCTGNISRSPMAELLIRNAVGGDRDLVVSSAGVHALVGQPMDAGAATVMRELGLNPAGHRARQFEPAMAASADLILTAERYHLETVLKQAPTALRRTFTIREFARIAEHLRPATRRQVVAQASVVRGLAPRPKDPLADDIADPHGQPVEVSRATAAELTRALGLIVRALGPERPDSVRPGPAGPTGKDPGGKEPDAKEPDGKAPTAKRRPLPYKR
jgi:protein-tyrosine phosphatase